MTAERYRVPPIRGARTTGYGHHDHTSVDLFAHNLGEAQVSPHPAFVERLEAFRRYGVEGLQKLAQRPMVQVTDSAHQPLTGPATLALPRSTAASMPATWRRRQHATID